MAVIKEYFCKAHGHFEAIDAICPHGCSATSVERVFITAPGYPQKMGGIDRTLKSLASDFNMTDMKHNSNGSISGGSTNPLAPRWSGGGLAGLQKEGHQLGQSGLQQVQQTLRKPESFIPANVVSQSAKELKV